MRRVDTPQSLCLCGFARCEITPPVGMYNRIWGAATHDVSTGVHRPLWALALAMEAAPETEVSLGGESARKVIVTLDHCALFGRAMDEFLSRVERRASLPQRQLQITFTHTHAAGMLDLSRVEMPGGQLMQPYLDRLVDEVAGLVTSAVESRIPTWIVYGTGRCSLAANRDYWDEQLGHFVCGFNPDGPADDTVLVARLSDQKDQVLATVVNYACHPTTLAWQNSLISPDFPGTMREVVEAATGAPCVFLQGASGDLGPREGLVGDVAVAERNGRQLAYAALAALESLPPAGAYYEYAGPLMSGTMLGTWRHVRLDDAARSQKGRWQSRQWKVSLPVRRDLMAREQAEQEQAHWERREAEARATGDSAAIQSAHAHVERWRREMNRLKLVPSEGDYPLEVCAWRIGDAFWVAVAGEEYQYFQQALRQRVPDHPVIVTTINNSSLSSYLPTFETYGRGIYQETIALLAPGALETLTDEVGRQLVEWLREVVETT